MNVLIGILLAAIGAGALAGGGRAVRRNARFRRWPETVARFVSKEMRDSRAPGADAGDVEAAVEYEYAAGGETRRGTRIYVVGSRSTGGIRARARVARYLDRFRDGMSVRFDPERPDDAALFELPRGYVVTMLVAGVIFLLAALVAFASG